MKRMEPVSNWQAFWLVFLSSGGTAAVLMLAGFSALIAWAAAISVATMITAIATAWRSHVARVSDWLRLHPWIPAAFAIGALLGVTLCLPLIPYELPESHASLIGAALGAFVAVWGAAWVADGKERRTKALARRYIRQHMWVFRTTLKQELDRAERALDVGDIGTVTDACGKLVNLSSASRPVFEKSFPAMQPIFASLGPAGIIGSVDLQHATHAMLTMLDTLVDGAGVYVAMSDKLLQQRTSIDIAFATMDRD